MDRKLISKAEVGLELGTLTWDSVPQYLPLEYFFFNLYFTDNEIKGRTDYMDGNLKVAQHYTVSKCWV